MPLLTPTRLNKMVKLGFDKMQHFRKARLRFLSQFVTRFYGRQATNAVDMEDKKASPLNLLHQAITTYVPNLAYNDPKCKIRTNYMGYRPYADVLELGVNELAKRTKLRDTLRKTITDAILLCGWIKTGLATSDQTLDMEGELYNVGEVYACRVDPDDMVVDPLARELDECIYIGNRFRLPRQTLLDMGIYDADQIRKLQGRYGEMQKAEAALLSSNPNMQAEANTEMDYVDLVEVYLPHEKIIVTLPYDRTGSGDKYLRVVDYDGPDTGPYHQLGFCWVPDNVMPVAPAMVWFDLHMMANRIARKIARQSERMKQIMAFEGSATEDAQEIVDADDGETVRVDNIDGIKEVRFGGTNPEAYEYLQWLKQNFSEAANNIDLLSGTKASAPTATQAEMLQSNSSVRLGDMQGIVYNFTADVERDLMFYLHTDPLIELPLVHRKDGVDQQVVYTPQMRKGEWMDYNLTIQPYSMARQDPNMKVRRVLEFATNVIPAAAQAFQMLGPAFNIQGFLRVIVHEIGLEEADEIINNAALQLQMQRLLLAGPPPDGKVGQWMGPGSGMMAMGPMQPNQPNPGQMGPNNGISTGTEKASAQQATAGELQQGYPSANAMAMSR